MKVHGCPGFVGTESSACHSSQPGPKLAHRCITYDKHHDHYTGGSSLRKEGPPAIGLAAGCPRGLLYYLLRPPSRSLV